MPLKRGTYDLTDMQVGLGIGCTVAILLMIFPWIKELYDCCTYVRPSSPRHIQSRSDGKLPRAVFPSYIGLNLLNISPLICSLSSSRILPEGEASVFHPTPTPPVRIPIPDKSPPPYPTVDPIVLRGDSFIRPDPPTREPVRSFRRVASLPKVDVSIPVYPGRVVEVKCSLSVCQEYFRSLNLDHYFQQRHDCYCIQCRPDHSQKTHKRGGYYSTIPYGWARFRIQTDPAQSQPKKIFQHWATSYYGTSEEKLEQILRNRCMPLSGDVLSGGAIFSDHSGYEHQWLTSPSIYYTSDLRFSPIKTFTLPNRRGEIYNVQVVLQCKQSPGTFDIQAGRPGLCNVISPNEIEWKSNQRSTLIPIGLMIRMNKR